MKRLLTIPVILFTMITPSFATPGWLIGFGAGVAIQFIPYTRNHIIMPVARKIQRTVRPVPQDKIDRDNMKAERARQKIDKKNKQNN